MNRNKTVRDMELLGELNELFVCDSHVLSHLDDDGDVVLKVFFSPQAFATAIIMCSQYGFMIRIDFHFGDIKHKYALTKTANELNSRMREGAFFIDPDECSLVWKNHIPYCDGMKAIDLMRSFKIGIATFLTTVDEFIKAMESDESEDGVVIVDAEGGYA